MEYVYAAMLLHSAEKEIDDDAVTAVLKAAGVDVDACLLYTSPSPRDLYRSRMPSSA